MKRSVTNIARAVVIIAMLIPFSTTSAMAISPSKGPICVIQQVDDKASIDQAGLPPKIVPVVKLVLR